MEKVYSLLEIYSLPMKNNDGFENLNFAGLARFKTERAVTNKLC